MYIYIDIYLYIYKFVTYTQCNKSRKSIKVQLQFLPFYIPILKKKLYH